MMSCPANRSISTLLAYEGIRTGQRVSIGEFIQSSCRLMPPQGGADGPLFPTRWVTSGAEMMAIRRSEPFPPQIMRFGKCRCEGSRCFEYCFPAKEPLIPCSWTPFLWKRTPPTQPHGCISLQFLSFPPTRHHKRARELVFVC